MYIYINQAWRPNRIKKKARTLCATRRTGLLKVQIGVNHPPLAHFHWMRGRDHSIHTFLSILSFLLSPFFLIFSCPIKHIFISLFTLPYVVFFFIHSLLSQTVNSFKWGFSLSEKFRYSAKYYRLFEMIIFFLIDLCSKSFYILVISKIFCKTL